MSKKCKAYSASKLGLEAPDTRKAFYAGWDAAIEQALTPGEPVAFLHDDGHWTHAKTEAGRRLSERLTFAGSPKIGVYTAPQPPQQTAEWADLPPEEIKALVNLPGAGRPRTAIEMAYAVQAKLRQKNGGGV